MHRTVPTTKKYPSWCLTVQTEETLWEGWEGLWWKKPKKALDRPRRWEWFYIAPCYSSQLQATLPEHGSWSGQPSSFTHNWMSESWVSQKGLCGLKWEARKQMMIWKWIKDSFILETAVVWQSQIGLQEKIWKCHQSLDTSKLWVE